MRLSPSYGRSVRRRRRCRRTSQSSSPVASVTRTRIARLRRRPRVADDARAVGVPADGVAAAEHRERAEALEPAGAVAAGARRRGAAARAIAACSRPSARHEPRARCRPAAAPRSNVSSCRRSCCDAALARAPTGRASPRASACVSSATCAAAHREARREAGERRPRRRACARGGSSAARAPRAAARRRSRSRSMRAQNSSLRGDDDLGGGRRRRRAQVGDEVGDGDVGLVADGRNDRHRASCAMARATTSSLNAQRSSIEPPPRPTMTTSTPGTRPIARSAARDLERRALALHARRPDDEVRVRDSAGRSTLMMSRIAAPSSEVTMPILRGSAGSGRLRAGVEQPFGLQPLLQLIERELQRAEALRLQVLADELILALRLVDARRVPRATTRRPSAGLNFR